MSALTTKKSAKKQQ